MTTGVRRAAVGVAGLLLVGSQLAGGSSAGAQSADVSATYQCGFPDGSQQQVTAEIKAAFPDSAAAGDVVRPGAAVVTVRLPAAKLGDLAGSGASQVVGTARLVTVATQGGNSTSGDWPKLAAPPVATANQQDVPLTLSGDFDSAAAITAGPSGSVTFTAGALDIALSPQKSDGSAIGASPLSVSCSPSASTGPTLGTVPVSGQAPSPKATKAHPPPPKIPPGCHLLPRTDYKPYQGCMYMSGYSNVAKLNAATAINDPALPNPALISFRAHIPDDGTIEADFQLVAPLKSVGTFLGFNFMPVTATIAIDQDGLGSETSSRYPDDPDHQQVTVKMNAYIRILEASVNGTSLKLGTQCRSAQPAHIELHDIPHTASNPVDGNIRLTGTYTIPRFTGCGTDENLDPMFNGVVAGNGNYLKVVQGQLCIGNANCPPVMPPLQR